MLIEQAPVKASVHLRWTETHAVIRSQCQIDSALGQSLLPDQLENEIEVSSLQPVLASQLLAAQGSFQIDAPAPALWGESMLERGKSGVRLRLDQENKYRAFREAFAMTAVVLKWRNDHQSGCRAFPF
jgi:hypothetical protein